MASNLLNYEYNGISWGRSSSSQSAPWITPWIADEPDRPFAQKAPKNPYNHVQQGLSEKQIKDFMDQMMGIQAASQQAFKEPPIERIKRKIDELLGVKR